MLLDPRFLAEQMLNSLQFSMLLFLLAIGLSVVFGLMDYLNLSHGTIYMFAAYVAYSLTHLGGSFWLALALAPLVAAAVGVSLYFVLLKHAEKGGHLTQVLLTVGVIYMGTDLLRIAYGDLPKGVSQPPLLSGTMLDAIADTTPGSASTRRTMSSTRRTIASGCAYCSPGM